MSVMEMLVHATEFWSTSLACLILYCLGACNFYISGGLIMFA